MRDETWERLDEILRALTPTQLRFVAARPHCTSHAEAAERAGLAKDTVYRWDEETKGKVEEAVHILGVDAIESGRKRLESLVGDAIGVLESEMEHGVVGDNTRLRAAMDILDRVNLTGEQRVDVTSAGEPITRVSSEEHRRSVEELLEMMDEPEGEETVR